MRSLKAIHVFSGLLGWLCSVSDVMAEQPRNVGKKSEFVPTHVAVEDVTLSSTNGNPLAVIAKGRKVVSESMDGTGRLVFNSEILQLRTVDGKFGLAYNTSFSRLSNTIQVTQEAKDVAEASNQFAFDLYQHVRRQEGNLFFSPASISAALAMTYAGSVGDTQREMATVLKLQGKPRIHEGFSTMLSLLNCSQQDNGYSLSTANRLWGAANFQFEAPFLALTRNQYRAELEQLDFGNSENARRTINDWVEVQTRHKIKGLIPANLLNSQTRLVLTNAISFEGGWNEEFSKNATKNAPFRVTFNQTTQVPTMRQTATFRYGENADAQILELPYRGDDLAMLLVLPKAVDGIGGLETNLTSDNVVQWASVSQWRLVEVHLPKFKMNSQFRLSDILRSMGLATAFSSRADFSAMSQSEGMMISEVVHQAFVDVNEKGTEAAAATAVVLAPTAAVGEPAPPPKPVMFRADHPFVFAIRDNRTGSVLFLGRVQNPKM